MEAQKFRITEIHFKPCVFLVQPGILYKKWNWYYLSRLIAVIDGVGEIGDENVRPDLPVRSLRWCCLILHKATGFSGSAGCDGSVLLKSTANNQAERDATPNQSLRGFQVIDAVKSAVEKACPGVVSCADILTLVARDAVSMLHGPYWEVPTGRRDGRVSIATEALTDLLPPFANIAQLKGMFAAKGLSVKDLAVLSGGHTIGTSHCTSFSNRLYNFTGKGDSDPKLDKNYVAQLKIKCKPSDASTLVEMDPGSFKTFDEDYYTLVAKKRGLFQSDAALLDDAETKTYVTTQATTHGATFAKDFAESMVKMGNIGVLTGKNGEIRKQCSFVN